MVRTSIIGLAIAVLLTWSIFNDQSANMQSLVLREYRSMARVPPGSIME
jgi:hypothetical protein